MVRVTLQLTVSRSVGQSVSQSVRSFWHRAPFGTDDQILPVVKTVAVSFVMGRPPCREEWSVS